MKSWRNAQRLALFLTFSFVSNLRSAEKSTTTDVDLLLTNGNIYTLNEKQPKAEAVAAKNGRIIFIGSNEQAKKFHAARTVDLREHTLVPGLTDSHCHIFGIGEREMTLNLEGTNTHQNFLAKVKERAAKTARGQLAEPATQALRAPPGQQSQPHPSSRSK